MDRCPPLKEIYFHGYTHDLDEGESLEGSLLNSPYTTIEKLSARSREWAWFRGAYGLSISTESWNLMIAFMVISN